MGWLKKKYNNLVTDPEATERLKRILGIAEVAKRESLQVETAEIEARVKEVRAQYTDKDIDVDKLRELVEEELLTEKTMKWLEEHATIELVPEGSLTPNVDTQSEIVTSDEAEYEAETNHLEEDTQSEVVTASLDEVETTIAQDE